MKTTNVILFLSLLLYSLTAKNQSVTKNDGFEGAPEMGTPPPGWFNCGTEMNPSVDTQPGFFDNQKPASEGDTYISMVTRELNEPGTYEIVWANLETPFLKDHCYNLQFDCSLSKDFNGSVGFETYYFDNPCVLRIEGFNGDCENSADRELLWESDTLTNFDWKTMDANFRPDSSTYHRIAVYPYFLDENEPKNSAVFVDHLRFTSGDHVYEEDGRYFLPEWAKQITWYYYGDTIEGGNTHEIPIVLNGDYTVTYFDEDSCFHVEKLELEFNYDPIDVYPNPTPDDVMISFLSEHEPYTMDVEVYDATGRKVYEHGHSVGHGYNVIELDLPQLASGTYMVHFQRYQYAEETHPIIIK
ncbi:MAG: T9SS type A sorting domain-containing protein [Bacteroidota bacterium]